MCGDSASFIIFFVKYANVIYQEGVANSVPGFGNRLKGFRNIYLHAGDFFIQVTADHRGMDPEGAPPSVFLFR